MEAHAQAPIVGGNRLTLLLNGEQIYPAILSAIRGARRTITYAQYSYEDGQIASDLAEALAERCRAGVRVHVLLDSVGTLSMPREYVELMTRDGCQVVSFRPDRPARASGASTTGITGASWSSTDGSASRAARASAASGWATAASPTTGATPTSRSRGRWSSISRERSPRTGSRPPGRCWAARTTSPAPIGPKGQTHAQIIRSGPRGGSYAMYTTFLLALSSARRSIKITNPYVLLDDQMIETLRPGGAPRGARSASSCPA